MKQSNKIFTLKQASKQTILLKTQPLYSKLLIDNVWSELRKLSRYSKRWHFSPILPDEKLVKGLTADKVPALSKQWALRRKKWLHSLLATLPALTQGSEDKVDEISGCVCGVAGISEAHSKTFMSSYFYSNTMKAGWGILGHCASILQRHQGGTVSDH